MVEHSSQTLPYWSDYNRSLDRLRRHAEPSHCNGNRKRLKCHLGAYRNVRQVNQLCGKRHPLLRSEYHAEVVVGDLLVTEFEQPHVALDGHTLGQLVQIIGAVQQWIAEMAA